MVTIRCNTGLAGDSAKFDCLLQGSSLLCYASILLEYVCSQFWSSSTKRVIKPNDFRPRKRDAEHSSVQSSHTKQHFLTMSTWFSRRHVVDHETVHPGLVVNLLSLIKAVPSKKPSVNMMLSLIKLLAATIRALWHFLKLWLCNVFWYHVKAYDLSDVCVGEDGTRNCAAWPFVATPFVIENSYAVASSLQANATQWGLLSLVSPSLEEERSLWILDMDGPTWTWEGSHFHI